MWEFLSNAKDSIHNILEKLNSLNNITTKQQLDIEKLLKLSEGISRYEHLHEIDNLWTSNKNYSE